MVKFKFELAQPKDSNEILEILEESDFNGNISVLYTRRPDAFKSFMKEGKDVILLICRDLRTNKIAGFGAASIHSVFINQKKELCAYLFGLRVAKQYHKIQLVLHKGYQLMLDLLTKRGIKYIFTTILNDNIEIQKLLTKKRSFMPNYFYLGDYQVHFLKSHSKVKRLPLNYTFTKIKSE